MSPNEIAMIGVAASYLLLFYMIKYGYWIPYFKDLLEELEDSHEGASLRTFFFLIAPISLAMLIGYSLCYGLSKVIQPVKRDES